MALIKLLLMLSLVCTLPLLCKFYFKRELNWLEVGVNIGVVLIAVTALWYAGKYSQMAATEILNGQVTSKDAVRVHCEHSYACNCRTVRDGDNSSHEECDTCYLHAYDVDWRVFTTVGIIYINRVDSQGVVTPPRWKIAHPGDPASVEHRYLNYLRAVPGNIYQITQKGDAALPPVPNYPRVYDYYRINRVLTVGKMPQLDQRRWNQELSMALRMLGPKKQVNVILLLVANPDPMYRYKVEAAWQGANKNDVVVFLGAPDGHTIAWTDVMSFAHNKGNEMFILQLKRGLKNLGTLNDSTAVVTTITKHIEAEYTRPQMADFEYLKGAIEPPFWFQLFCLLCGLALSVGLAIYFSRADIDLRWPPRY